MTEEVIPLFGTADRAAHFWLFIWGLWAVCTVSNIGIASWKGRNTWIWGIAGFIFGPFAFLVMLMVPSKYGTKKAGEENTETPTESAPDVSPVKAGVLKGPVQEKK